MLNALDVVASLFPCGAVAGSKPETEAVAFTTVIVTLVPWRSGSAFP